MRTSSASHRSHGRLPATKTPAALAAVIGLAVTGACAPMFTGAQPPDAASQATTASAPSNTTGAQQADNPASTAANGQAAPDTAGTQPAPQEAGTASSSGPMAATGSQTTQAAQTSDGGDKPPAPPRQAGNAAQRTALGDQVSQPERPSDSTGPGAQGAAGPGGPGDTGTEPGNPGASCTSDLTTMSGQALVSALRQSTTSCVNSLFSLTGAQAQSTFSEANMTAVANAYAADASTYTGDNSNGTAQLVLFLRAGYYVQYYQRDAVGAYSDGLKQATASALDAFFASAHSRDVTDANGEILAESVTLIDSSELNARYLDVVKRLLTDYNSSYDSSYWMLQAVNNVYTVLFRGHQVPAFVTAVSQDPSVLTTLRDFAVQHADMLGGEHGYLVSNAGREMARFLGDASIKDQVKPLVIELLGTSSISGPTSALWVGLAEMTDHYDQAACADYGTCGLSSQLQSAVLTQRYTCSSSITIVAQSMTDTELADTCNSLTGEDAFFHSVVKDNGPVANDNNSTIEVDVFDSSSDYQSYAGAMFGIDTNNGGMYLEGDPSAAGNQPRFVAYEAEWLRPDFQIWNLNHEYTHYLDGRFDMAGDFNSNVTTPTIWWIEGFAEAMSYSYRGVPYPEAQTEASAGTYHLSELWNTTYSADTTRIYRWGYLATMFMLTQHPQETQTVLGYYRTGQWEAAHNYLTTTIGATYDGEFSSYLQRCAAGDCGTLTGSSATGPTAASTQEVSPAEPPSAPASPGLPESSPTTVPAEPATPSTSEASSNR